MFRIHPVRNHPIVEDTHSSNIPDVLSRYHAYIENSLRDILSINDKLPFIVQMFSDLHVKTQVNNSFTEYTRVDTYYTGEQELLRAILHIDEAGIFSINLSK